MCGRVLVRDATPNYVFLRVWLFRWHPIKNLSNTSRRDTFWAINLHWTKLQEGSDKKFVLRNERDWVGYSEVVA
jgi:hypothetical protein